ncbi:ferritin-like superfamily [Talaromyces proteolyticus]|uniref:Ferritin n=1 Tax=Talaromyces proteolyticus TaxID=1131652 RepID=A0AAD4KX05_9EURO|nr:ferritin-like superfamily [Talaromyces proteolyticus]KAH8697854.1 ferritin-like superfamily [Talaromyces proteolyticus]
MPGTEEAQRLIKEFSDKNVDNCCRTSTFSLEVEESVRGHIHQELVGWLFYRKLAADCWRANVSLHGFGLLFEKSAVECLADASWLERYLIQRGGRCKPTNIEAPTCEFPDNPVEPIIPLHKAVETERKLLDDLERLMRLAEKAGCYSLCTALDRRFLQKQTQHVKDLADLLQQTVRVSKHPGHGIFHLDRELRNANGNLPWGGLNDPDSVTLEVRSLCSQLENSQISGRH